MSARFCILLTASLWGAGVLGAGDEKDRDTDKLQGEWMVASMELRGKVMSEEERKQWKLVVKGDEWQQTFKSDELKMTFKVDPSKNPKEIDYKWTDPSGKEWVLKGIYKLDGNTLTVCKRNEDNEDRPKEFKAGDSTLLAVFNRVAKK